MNRSKGTSAEPGDTRVLKILGKMELKVHLFWRKIFEIHVILSYYVFVMSFLGKRFIYLKSRISE